MEEAAIIENRLVARQPPESRLTPDPPRRYKLNHMVERFDEALDQTFAALGDATRRAILARLRNGARTVSEIAEPFDMSLNAVSKHLRVLERASLIRREIRGREHHCFL